MIADLLAPRAAIAPVAAPATPFARVDIYPDAAAVAAAWSELERTAPCSIYQTRRFLDPWAETLGRAAGLRPCYMLARDRADQPIALFPLGLERCGPITTARLLGGKDANLQLALLHSATGWTGESLRPLLRETARLSGVDVFVFTNQPHAYAGETNPLACLPRGESPSAAYGTALPASSEALLAAKLSKDTRKKLRKKEAKLDALGPVRHVVARTPAERATILEAFLTQKNARFQDLGIASDFGTAAMRAFIERASATEPPGIELHALLAGERIVATYGGAAQGERWSGMFNSFDADEEIARSSPGDLLLMRIVESCCARGFSAFDLGVGEARYKTALCDEPIPLFDAAIGFGPLGCAAAAFVLARQALKQRVKRNPRLLAIIRWVARQLRRTRSASKTPAASLYWKG